MQDFLKQTFMGRVLGQRLLPGGEHRGVHHISPLWLLATIFITLVVLTFTTVSVMHLKHDRPFNIFLFYTCFALVVLFLGFALLDSTTYQPIVDQSTGKGML
jgi:hypothetical protein